MKQKQYASDYDPEVESLMLNFGLPDLLRLRRLMIQKRNQLNIDPNISEQKKLDISMKSAILDLAISIKRAIAEPNWWRIKNPNSKYKGDRIEFGIKKEVI